VSLNIINHKKRRNVEELGSWIQFLKESKDQQRQRMGMETLEAILAKTRLQWLGISTDWTTAEYHKTSTDMVPKMVRKSGGSRKSWSDTLTQDLQYIAMTWTDFREIVDDQQLRRNCLIQCVTTLRRTKVKVRTASITIITSVLIAVSRWIRISHFPQLWISGKGF